MPPVALADSPDKLRIRHQPHDNVVMGPMAVTRWSENDYCSRDASKTAVPHRHRQPNSTEKMK
jgi:hypothetical protein